jgi:hypothetical protein
VPSLRHYIDLITEASQEPQTCFIRFGEIPENERSGIGASPHWIHAYMTQGREQEFGVSVYDAFWNASRKVWQIDGEVNYATLDELIAQATEGKLKIYRVTGIPVDAEHLSPEELEAHYREGNGDDLVSGADGETLLRNVRIVQELTLRDIYEPNMFDPDQDLPKPPPDRRLTGRVIVLKPGQPADDRGEQKIEWQEVAHLIGGDHDAYVYPIHLTYRGEPAVLFVDEEAEMKRLPPNRAATDVIQGDGRPVRLPPHGILGTCVLMVGCQFPENDYES